jgi:hypothetical protein
MPVPVVKALQKYAKELKEIYGKRLILFLDFHGHSIKKNVFCYGPDYQMSDVFNLL